MKRIKIKRVLGSGLCEGTESILYETKEELEASELCPVKSLFWEHGVIEGVIRNVANKSLIVTKKYDTYTILPD